MQEFKTSLKSNDLESYKALFQIAEKNLRDWIPGVNENDGPVDVIDFFSGCGGMSLGFSVLAKTFSSFNLVGAVDINEKALETYSTNFKCKVLKRDIRELCNDDGVNLLRKEFNLEIKKTRPLVVIGCAPCQGFSPHQKKNNKKHDERNTLIGAFTETAVKLNPDYIIMENVPEILGKKYWSHYEEARSILQEQGFEIKQTVYNSASFGVPQSRNRAIIIAAKKDFNLPIPLLNSSEFKTVRDAIGDLPKVKAGEICKTDLYHRSANHKANTIKTITKVPKDGGNRPNGIGPKCLDKVKGFYDVYGRLFWDKPSITLTQYARNPASGRFTHPEEDRGLTIREAARLQSFPDGFKFQGSLDHCFKQIGESVPPLLSLAIAVQLIIDISSQEKRENVDEIKSVQKPINGNLSRIIPAAEISYAHI